MTERLIDRIVARTPLAPRVIHVPEWDVDIYFEPLTRAQIEEASKGLDDGNGERSKATVSLLILTHLAKDKDGNRLFRRDDVELLRTRADVSVLSRVEAFMWGTLRPTPKDAEREITENPT